VSQTAAERFKRLARENSTAVAVVQTPKALSSGGCSYAVRCNRRDLAALLSLCKRRGVGYSRVFCETTGTNGKSRYEEIQ